jgi:hypothetical protein
MTEVLETERLTLRHATTADDRFIFELVNDPAFIRNIGDPWRAYAGGCGALCARRPIASYEKFGFGMYVVEVRESGHADRPVRFRQA